jgi:hypothetical protein
MMANAFDPARGSHFCAIEADGRRKFWGYYERGGRRFQYAGDESVRWEARQKAERFTKSTCTIARPAPKPAPPTAPAADAKAVRKLRAKVDELERKTKALKRENKRLVDELDDQHDDEPTGTDDDDCDETEDEPMKKPRKTKPAPDASGYVIDWGACDVRPVANVVTEPPCNRSVIARGLPRAAAESLGDRDLCAVAIGHARRA